MSLSGKQNVYKYCHNLVCFSVREAEGDEETEV